MSLRGPLLAAAASLVLVASARAQGLPGLPYIIPNDCQLECCRLGDWHTAVRVPAGSKLRLEVASAWFPFFSRNLGTGGHNETETEWVVGEQTVFHDAERPSHLLLPVIDPSFAE